MKKVLALMTVLFFLSTPSAYSQICNGDFDCDHDVDGTDAVKFKADFFRKDCPDCLPCVPPAPVQKTGQTMLYYEGDDGALEKGVEWPNPRFTDNENGTVTDNLTGLIWLKDANCFGERNWWEALTDCNGLAAGDNLCNSGTFSLTDGSSGADWRLPNRFELESLLDMKYWGPALSNRLGTGQWSLGDPFTNLWTNGFYWSSTTYANYTPYAWGVGMGTGHLNDVDKTNTYYVWPVRGGQ